MKFGQPLLTTELSGSIGGATASKARGGVRYFRLRARPGNPRSFAQSTIRAIMSGLAAGWGSLTGAQRDAWAALASGSSSGIDAYVKGNVQQRLHGEAANAAAPVTLALSGAPIIADGVVTADASDHKIDVGLANAPALIDAANVFVSAPQSASRLSRQHGYTFAGTIENPDSTVELQPDHPAYNMAAGQVVYVKVVYFGMNSGANKSQSAAPQEFRVTVQA
jgi:hypothetical protein